MTTVRVHKEHNPNTELVIDHYNNYKSASTASLPFGLLGPGIRDVLLVEVEVYISGYASLQAGAKRKVRRLEDLNSIQSNILPLMNETLLFSSF